MSPDARDAKDAAKETKGKLKEKVGWATADREVEAKGRVEREQVEADTGRKPDDSVESVKKAEQEVRRANEEVD